MSAVPRQPGGSFAGMRMRAADFLSIGETTDRYELVHGVVQMSPPPSTLHQSAASVIHVQLAMFVTRREGYRFFAEVGWEIDASTVLVPDLVAYRPGRIRGFPPRLAVPPDLVIEILSPKTRASDLTIKRREYERVGVLEYWVVDPSDAAVRCFRLQEGAFVEVNVSGDRLESVALDGFVLDLQPLRALARQA